MRRNPKMTAPTPQVYTNSPPEALAALRALVELRPEAIYRDARELASLLPCSAFEIEEARRWILEDGLEVRA